MSKFQGTSLKPIEKETPRRRWVEEEYETTVQRTVYETMKVPVNAAGEALTAPVPLGAPEYEFLSELPSVGTSTVLKPSSPPRQQVYETKGQVTDTSSNATPMQRTELRKATSIIVPETMPAPAKMGSIREGGDVTTPALKGASSVMDSPAASVAPALNEKPRSIKSVLETSGTVQSMSAPEMPGAGLSRATGNEQAADK